MTRRKNRILVALLIMVAAAAAFLVMRHKTPWEGVISSAFDKPNPERASNAYGEPPWTFRLHYWEVQCDDGVTRLVEVPYTLWQRGTEGDRLRQNRFGRWPEIVAKVQGKPASPH